MVKQISLHAAGNAERSAYGSKYSDNHLQDSFPNFLFHFLFPFFFKWFNNQKEIGQVCTPVVFPSVF